LKEELEGHALELDKQYHRQLIINENLVQFNKIISHDLQEPIRKIQMFIDVISKDPDTTLSVKSKRLSEKLNTAAEKLKTLTKSLEEYIAIDNEKTYSHVNLNDIIEVARLRAVSFRQFSDFDMTVEMMPTIKGHEEQLQLLFFHLIDNAIKFRDPERKLVMKVNQLILEENIYRMSNDQYKYAEHLRISFEDNGIGIPEGYKDYVFELLNKLDDATSDLGIGLPFVKKIVQNHSGEIRVHSQSGIGTRFEIELPIDH
jgi:phosphoserine phosphatase RsbU/P